MDSVVRQISTYQKNGLFYLALLTIGLAGSIALLRSSPFGLGLISDTVAYVNGAENIANGNGYTETSSGGGHKPIIGFPPMFSIFLAPISLIGLDVLKSARIMIVCLFGLDIILVGLLIHRISHSILFSLFGALLMAFSDILLEVYLFLLSEPLFITFMLAAILFFSIYYKDRRGRWLILTGLLLGLASLTRLPGLWVLASLIITILLLETNWFSIFTLRAAHPANQFTRDKLRILLTELSLPIKEITFVLITSLPLILIWVFYTYSLNTGLGNRTLIWHPIPFNTFFEGFKNLLSWLAPKSLTSIQPIWGRLLSLFSLLLLPGLFLYLLWQIRRRFHKIQEPSWTNSSTITTFSLAMHVVTYMILMVITISLIDASEPLNSRLLSVVYIPLIILFASSLAWIWNITSRLNARMLRFSRIVIGLFCIGLVFTSISDGIIAVNQMSREGYGYANRVVVGSKAVEDIRNLPPVLIYSNNSDGILLLTGKPATIIPTPIDPVTTLARPDYSSDVELVQKQVFKGQAILILFDMNNKANTEKYSIYKTLTTGLPLMTDYGAIQIFGHIK